MTRRLIIFDCDGTLVDSEPLVSEVMVEMVGEHGLALDLQTSLRMFAGRKLDEGLAELENREDYRFPESFVPEFRARSAQRLADAVHIPVWGVFVTTPEVRDAAAKVNVQVEVKNKSKKLQNVRIESVLLDPSGKEVAERR